MSGEPIRKSVTVERTQQEAFDLFTTGIGMWWPLDTHSRADAEKDETTERVIFENHAGGRIYEVLSTGVESPWGAVTVCEPPRRLVFDWKPSDEDRPPTEVEVTFSDEGLGRTRVDLEHRRWESIPDLDPADYEGYAVGWDYVFVERFGEAAGGTSSDGS